MFNNNGLFWQIVLCFYPVLVTKLIKYLWDEQWEKPTIKESNLANILLETDWNRIKKIIKKKTLWTCKGG